MSKVQFTASEKLAILLEIDSGQIGVMAAAKTYGISKTTVVKWRRRYEVYGYKGLEIQSYNRTYSVELKLQAVQDYLTGHYSQYEIIDKYKIASRTQLKNWVDKYNGHSSLKSYNEGAKAMTKGRATTWQERIDIVHYCLAHKHDYQETASQYQVSYQQVYQWVKKYEDGGLDALQDRRGRKKPVEELTETEQEKMAMKKLEYENERLRAEIAFLKKLQEFQRRRV
ncbi:helix-turn-helix domain-containing protein [Brevibacillus choshinensis]|uniref:Helix-turn-helix domain-containing protein n=1 Tax=Brevibacillus choshinensis TaxID=54911 RepID=A0ABX7FWI9_BRECH|nr:helix-turn-helix domain-containing protein [Brevibacillus choshinensis]QRG66678.1 helix-turn-helix domain-containing protein [Brevibacillus choshinensis]QRG67146.1 helix-turn-helix domain-containing protein [Brevibacillus choshinensis]QRG70310.1 helix-turn-helix domain-containing protein [Brevibacillus choshinensis]